MLDSSCFERIISPPVLVLSSFVCHEANVPFFALRILLQSDAPDAGVSTMKPDQVETWSATQCLALFFNFVWMMECSSQQKGQQHAKHLHP